MRFKDILTFHSVPARTLLLEEGQVADTLYYIRKGCLRLFFWNDGKDCTFQFLVRQHVQAPAQSVLVGEHRAVRACVGGQG